jgi:cobalt-zinc-cadmium efflux system protein
MHDHTNCDHHKPASYGLAFTVGAFLNIAFVLGEVGFGVANRSLSLLADAGHNLGDVMGLLMGWMAACLATRPATARHTYGYRRSSILAALANSSLLMIGVGAVAWEAIQRLSEPVPVQGFVIMAVAGVGILVNGGTALMFLKGRKGDINIEAAYTHMLTDAIVAAGVVVAGLIMHYTGWVWMDPVTSLVLSVLVALSSWRMLRRSIDLALDAVPDGIKPEAVKTFLESLPGVQAVSDMHIWAVSTTETAMTAHLVVPKGFEPGFLAEIEHQMSHEFGIHHSTIQVDSIVGEGCSLAV